MSADISTKELKVLMLEDVAADAELAERALHKAGLNVSIKRVATKNAFLEALKTFKPDVILSDYSLPNFTGLEAFELMEDQTPRIPFLLVTGALPEVTVIDIIKAGIDDYILKENLQRLPSAFQNAYAKRSAERRNAELNNLRQKFIEIMAHQLRTPLTVVNWQLDHLLSGAAGKIVPAQEEILRIAYDANQKLITRIHDMLTVIDIEEGRAILNTKNVSLESLFKSVMVNVVKACQAKGITFDYKAPAKRLGAVTVDAEKINHVFEKLSENAVIYTPAHGKIVASLSQIDNLIRFEISDSGVGIPESEQESIFTAFFRATNASLALPDASGVGLAIAKYYIEQHGGKIGFNSKEGKGSTFWFELPISSRSS